MNLSSSPCCLVAFLLLGCTLAAGQQAAPRPGRRADWLHKARWGVFTHYLAGTVAKGDKTTVEAWNKIVDGFDVQAHADQIAAVGAKYCCITIGQNSGCYIAPNATYDKIVGIQPSKCARRDLVSDLYDALTPKGITLMVYLPSGAPDRDPIAVKKLGWKKGRYPFYHAKKYGPIERNRDLIGFQQKWDQIVADWSRRWGRKVAGWWFDGCYYPHEMYLHPDPPSFASLAAAARAGNPDSIVAFNSGVIPQNHPARSPDRGVTSITEHEDYTAGEVSTEMVECHGRWVGTAQFQILSYLGKTWGNGKPRFSNDFVIEYVREINHSGGAVTWDVPIQPDGRIPKPYLDQLKVLGDGLAKPRPMAPPGNLASRKPARLLNLAGTKPLWVNGAKHFARCGVDGDSNTHAQAGGEWPWTYQVDLLERSDVNRIVVTFPKDRYATEYKILVSPTGKDAWKTVAHETNVAAGRHGHTIAPTPARYVRVQAIKPDRAGQPGGQMGVTELEVYGGKRGK